MPKTEAIPAAGHTGETSVTPATLKKDGVIKETCTVCGKALKTTKIPYPKTIKLSAASFIYDGKAKKPTVTITGSDGKKISSSMYSLKYAGGRKLPGAYKVTITFKGNYSGTVTKTFKIVPKKVSGLKLKAGA